LKQLPALGLVETKGLIGAIEAADAMCKAAKVKLLGREKTNPAMITVQIIGETAAVKTAVEAGAAAAARVGELISTHVIPRPDLQLDLIILGLVEPEEDLSLNKQVEATVQKRVEVKEAVKQVATKPASNPEVKPKKTTQVNKDTKTAVITDSKLLDMKVTDLRTLARATDGFPIKGREISKANKEELLGFFAQIGKV
jgi:microcompartment protein CcmL/EutN